MFASDTAEPTLVKEINGAIAFVVRGGTLPIRDVVVNSSSALKVIGRTGVGYDNVDIAAATARKVPVIYTPGAGSRAVAEAGDDLHARTVQDAPVLGPAAQEGNWKSRLEAQARGP